MTPTRTQLGAVLSASTTALAAVAALAVTLTPAPAQACGGFFCNQGSPVNQVGEHILFALEDGVVTAHIQIQYQGPAESFSWVLPLPSIPDVGVGSERLFTTLRSVTDPSFKITWDNPEGCNYRNNCDCMFADSAGGVDDDGDAPPNESGVDILAAGEVGPYDFKVVQAGDGDLLFDWLNDNGYDVPAHSKSIVNWYADIDFVFLALKLLKDKEAGDIQPIVLGYEAEDMTCIPLQLTSIAADPDMPVFTWVLANARAVPLNYFHVVLNAKAFDWLNCAQPDDEWGCGWFNAYGSCQQEYLDLVTSAANSANGHGFVTEFAGESAVMKDTIYTDDMYDLEMLAAITSPLQFLQELLWAGFPNNTLVREIIKDHIPMPPIEHLPEDCQTEQGFYAFWNMEYCLSFMDPAWTFDAAALVADLDMKVLKPMAEAQALFERHPYMTRMFTTISPDEMTKDPIFSFNPDLPDVSNEHHVTAKAQCKEGSSWQAEKITIVHADGEEQSFHGEFNQCSNFEYDDDITTYPPAADIQILGEEGPPTSVPPEDVEDADDELSKIFPTIGQQDVEADPERNLRPIERTGTWAAGALPTGGDAPTVGGDSGCNGSGNGSPWALALLALGLAAITRRRRAA